MVARTDIDGQEVTTKAPKYPITLHISEGNKLLRLNQHKKALSCFDTGLKDQPKNVRCLLGKVKCLKRLLKYDEAKINAEEIIKLEPKSAEAYTLLGDTEFIKGNFENSYIAFSSGYRKRPYSLELRLGQQMCKKALDNSLNSDTSLILDKSDVKEVENVYQNKSRRQDNKRQRIFNRNQLYRKDLKIVKSLLNEDFSSISSKCQDAFDYLKERKDFWRMHNPCLNKAFVKTDQEEIDTQKLLAYASNKCLEAEKCFREGDIEISKTICHEIIDMIENSFLDSTIEISKVKADALHFLGLSYMIGDDSSSALKYHMHQLTIARNYKIVELKKRSFYDIGEDLIKCADYEKALAAFNQSMDFISTADEEAVVLYKISDCNLYLDNLKDATSNARKSLLIATSCDDHRLQCDTTMLLAEVAVRQKNMKEARNLYADALDIAEESGDSRLDEIKNLVNMFCDKFHDHSLEESILSLASRLSASRSSLKRCIGIGFMQSTGKSNSDYSDSLSVSKSEARNSIECLDADISSCRSSLSTLTNSGSIQSVGKYDSDGSDGLLHSKSETQCTLEGSDADSNSLKSNDKNINMKNSSNNNRHDR